MLRVVAWGRAAHGGTQWQARGVSHTLWAASMDTLGHPLPGSIWELWIRHQCPSAKGSSFHQSLCRHFISVVALTCWRTRQVECLHFSTLLSVTSPRECFSCRFQLCPPGGTQLPSRGVVGKTWDVNFALVFWGGGQDYASVPEGQAELYQCRSSSTSPALAAPDTWSGQNCAWMGEMVALGIPQLSSTLCFSVRLGKWGPSSGKETCPAVQGLVRWGVHTGPWLTSRCPVGPVASLGYVCHLEKVTTCFIVLKAVFIDLLFWTALLAVPCLKVWVGHWCEQTAILSHQLCWGVAVNG